MVTTIEVLGDKVTLRLTSTIRCFWIVKIPLSMDTANHDLMNLESR